MNSTNRLLLLVSVPCAVACVPIGQTNTSANTPSGQKQTSQDLDATASAKLGVRYYIGQGVPQDYVRAASLFKKACKMGSPDGCDNLGTCYAKGAGVPQDLPKAATIFQQACDSGAQGATGCNNLGVLYRDGRGVQQDQIQATALFKKACEADVAAGCNNFGVSLDSGRGIVQDRELALVHLNKACAGGDLDGCRNSQILEKEDLTPIRYLPESGTPSGQDSTARGHGPNGEKASGSQVGDRLVITGKLLPVPVPSGRINVGFLSNGRVECGKDAILKVDNGEPAVVSIYGDASVGVDGSFTLLIDKKQLRDHNSWGLVWFNPRNGDHADLQGSNGRTYEFEVAAAFVRRGSNGRTYEFEVADKIGEINLGPIKFKM